MAHQHLGERRNRPLLSAWGLRLTHIIIAVAILAQAPDLGDCWARGATEEQLEMITAENARCDGKCPLIEICEIEIDQGLSEVPLSCIASAHSSTALQEMGSRRRRDADFQGSKIRIFFSKGSSLMYVTAVMYTKSYTSGGQISQTSQRSTWQPPPTSCNCRFGAGRQSRYWSIRHTVSTETRGGACSSLRHRPANRTGSHTSWRSIAAGD